MNLIKELIDTLLPGICIYCNNSSRGRLFCNACLNGLNKYQPECYITRQKSKNWKVKDKGFNTYLNKIYYFYVYDNELEHLMMQIKYSFHSRFINEIITLLNESEEFKKLNFNTFDCITFVPLHIKREKWRGFNQSRIIANEIGKIRRAEVESLLKKIRNTKPQIELGKKDRQNNLKEAFTVSDEINLSNFKRILIIDDICTTGSTLTECAKTLKQSNPDLIVEALCFARPALIN